MKILFYLYPGILPQGPEFTGGWTLLFARLARTLASTGTGEYLILTATRFARHAAELPDRVSLRLIDDVELHATAREIAPLSATPTALAELARHEADATHPAISLLNDRIRSACGGFEPDMVVTFSMQAEYLRAIWPAAPILNVEAGAFSRTPFAFSLYFDHMGMYRSSAPARLFPAALTYRLPADTLELAADFRAWADNALGQDDPFSAHDYRSQFERLALLPLQVSNWYSFDDQCHYRTQFEYLYDVLSAAPMDIGVIATEYIQWGPVFQSGNSASNLDFLRARFPNLIIPPNARKYTSPSQYLNRHVDGVWSVSSNLGYQALLLGKRLGAPLRSFYRNVAHDHTPTEFFANLGNDAPPEDRLPFLAWYLENYLVPAPMLDDGNWLRQYLSDRRTAILAATDPMDGFVPLGTPDAIRKAWNAGQHRGPAGRWMDKETEALQRQAKADILLAKSENQAAAIRKFVARRDDASDASYILLNDIRSIDQFLHLGRNAVTQFIHDRMSLSGLHCLGIANTAEECAALLANPGIDKVKLVIFNGDGSLRHDSARCRDLMDFCAEMKLRSARCALINAVWHENSEILGARLDAFDVVTVRESISFDAIRRWRDDARVVPDISFAAFREVLDVDANLIPAEPLGQLSVIDNVNGDIATTLSEFAEFHRLPYYLMSGRHMDGILTDNTTAYDIKGTTFPRVLRTPLDLNRTRACLTGRFHGLAAALVAGVPALSLPSNTPKVEGMLDDFGLREFSLLPPSWLQLGHIRRYAMTETMLSNWDSAVKASIATRVGTAVDTVNKLFLEIAEIAGTNPQFKPTI